MFVKIYTTPGYIVSLILLNLKYVFRFRIVSHVEEFNCRSNTAKQHLYIWEGTWFTLYQYWNIWKRT